ncbi:hypothetical protein R3P38DRAFT_3189701 [Favolaschia claudopus]|uniref:Uncharacterized protein n=1 Tax=Favolaschia claudopus TaxID=2862362 RepID=A0AAV9Z7C0_9AGAR
MAVEISGEEVWEQAHAAAARANCFIRLAHSPAIRVKVNSSFSYELATLSGVYV